MQSVGINGYGAALPPLSQGPTVLSGRPLLPMSDEEVEATLRASAGPMASRSYRAVSASPSMTAGRLMVPRAGGARCAGRMSRSRPGLSLPFIGRRSGSTSRRSRSAARPEDRIGRRPRPPPSCCAMIPPSACRPWQPDPSQLDPSKEPRFCTTSRGQDRDRRQTFRRRSRTHPRNRSPPARPVSQLLLPCDLCVSVISVLKSQ